MKENNIIKIVYSIFVGALISIFVGVGINTFYPGPVSPDYSSKAATAEGRQLYYESEEYTVANEQYSQDNSDYYRNVSIVSLIIAVALLWFSIMYEKRLKMMADGILLGGLFTLIYGVNQGFASGNDQYLFLAMTISLAAVIYIGYHKFIKER